MQSSSDRFADAIRGAHRVSTTILLTDPDGATTALDVIEGSVTLDGTSATRAACSLTIAPDPDLIPKLVTDPLAPYGNTLTISRGVTYSDGTNEEIPLGVYLIDATTIDDSGTDLPIIVSGLDLSRRLTDAVIERADQIAAGTLCTDAIETLVREVEPLTVFDLDVSTITLPLLGYSPGEDRWDICQAIAQAAQCDLYYDSRGILVMRQHPTTDVVDLVVSEGEILTSASKAWTREDAVNRVVVEAENSTGDPVLGVAIDDDPNSPTVYGGPFGRLTFTWNSGEYIDGVSVQARADAVAETILSQKLGTGQQISFGSLVDPRLEPFDVVQIKRDRLGLDDLYIVDSITFALTDAEMTVQTRTARVALP